MTPCLFPRVHEDGKIDDAQAAARQSPRAPSRKYSSSTRNTFASLSLSLRFWGIPPLATYDIQVFCFFSQS